MRFIAIALVFLITTVASCSKDDNEMPEINVETIVIKGQGKSVDDLHVGDTVSVYLNLQSNKKDLNSFSCKFASAEDFSLRILDIDSTTTNYEGNNLEYHGFGTEPGVTVIARGTMYFGEQSEWRTMTVPIEDTGVSGLDITHLSVVFSSSKDGDKFVGEVGATLWVDNVVLNYEE